EAAVTVVEPRLAGLPAGAHRFVIGHRERAGEKVRDRDENEHGKCGPQQGVAPAAFAGDVFSHRRTANLRCVPSSRRWKDALRLHHSAATVSGAFGHWPRIAGEYIA